MATGKFVLYKRYKDRKTQTAKGTTAKDQNPLNSTKKAKKTVRQLNPEETRLYLYLIIDRDHVIKVKTEYVIYPKQWDFKKQLKNDKLTGSPEFNKKLLKLKDDIILKYQNTKEEFSDLSFNQVAKIVTDYGKAKEVPFNKKGKDFFQVLDDYIKYLEQEVAPGTVKKYVTLKKALNQFIVTNPKYKELSFSLIDHSFKDAFVKYLRNQAPRGRQKSRPEGSQKGILINTEAKYIECIKTFCKWSEERKFNRYTTYKEFENTTKANRKRKKQDHDIVTLTLTELRQFYTFDFSEKPSLDRVRDLWCFGAFTGQRWSDIESFDKSQLEGDVWSFIAYKTKKETEIDLTGYAEPALDILKKYDYKLPKISLTKFNLFIKDAAKDAGITSETKITRYVGAKAIDISKPKFMFLGSHSARKTCVSILLNDYNLNITHVLEITGHSDLKTLQKYINKDRKARREAISKTKSITEPLTIVKQKTA